MLQDLSAPRTSMRLGWYRLALLAGGALLLAFSFVDYYAYYLAKPLRQLCPSSDPSCPGGLLVARNAWHGFFGWFAVVLVLAATACVAASLFARHSEHGQDRQRVLAYPVLGLYALATVCVLIAIGIVPNAVSDAAVRKQARVIGGSAHYGDLISNQHAWGFWASLAVVLAGLVCAALSLVEVRARRQQ